MKFASTNTRWWLQAIAVSALLAGLFLSGFLSGASGTTPVYAQALRGGAAPRVPLTNLSGQDSLRYLPAGITRRKFSASGTTANKNAKGASGQTRAQLGGANGFDVPEKTVDISGTRLVGSDEIHPFWSSDGSAIYYESNASFVGDSNPDGYQLYRTPANPSQGTVPTGLTPTRLTNEPTANYRFPVVNIAGNRVAFGRQRVGSNRFDLYVAIIPTNPVPGIPGSFIPTVPDGSQLISLTNSDTSEPRSNSQAVINGRTFANVERATFASASNIVFSASLAGVNGGPASPFHLFTVNLDTLKVQQLTDGTADERNPAVSPDGRFVAFDSNATPGSYSVGSIATGVAATSNATQTNRNVFTIGASGATGPASDASQVIVFSYDGGNIFSNVQPAWSRLDANDVANQGGVRYYLAYASTRRTNNTAAATKDIYFVIANNTVTTTNVLQPETAPAAATPNVARRLDTADDDANGVPAYLFDDEYPTFPPFRNVLQIGFHSDRQGTQTKANVPGSGFVQTPGIHDLFVATLFDINAPTLLRWDSSSSTGDIVHINLGGTYNASPGSAVRNREQGLLPGTTVFFTVRAEDLESGIDSVYLQFKNPNSKYQSTAQGGNGVEHKEYDTGSSRDPGNPFFGPGFDLDLLSASRFSFTRPAFTIYEGTGPAATNYEVPGQPTTNIGREFEAEAINAGNRTNYINHRRNRGGKRGILPIAGLDDFNAFSGGALLDGTSPLLAPFPSGPANSSQNPTKTVAEGGSGAWLKLSLLPAAQQTPLLGGPGGQLYGAQWTVPAEASDWYMDVILFDKAVNPINPTLRSNWIIYDNVWGFSTANSLSPQSVDLLVVMDYALGQKFFSSRFGSSGEAFGRGFNNLPNIYYGVESYYTDPEVARYPDGLNAPPPAGGTDPRRWDPLGPNTGHPGSNLAGGAFQGTTNPLGVNSYLDSLLTNEAQIIEQNPNHNLPANPPGDTSVRLPSTGRYSLWRVLSRGPVPVNLLTDYLPTRSTSPPDQFLNAQGVPLETAPRTTIQANRMVIWASPFTANVFAGTGTIQDKQTQDNLANFVNQGGRLFISGQDIGYALVGNGQANSFYNQTLNAQLISDTAGNRYDLVAAGTTTINTDAFGAGGQHPYSQINITSPNTYTPPTSLRLVHETFAPAADFVGDGSFAADAQAGIGTNVTGFLDVIAPINGAVAEYNFAAGGGSAMVSSGNANGGRVVYMSTGFEGISNGWYTYSFGNPGITFVASRGRRSNVMHNITCALRTGTIVGRILDQNGSPVTDALVRAISTASVETSPAAGTGFTDANGNYQIQGLPAGDYTIFGYRAGFYTQKSVGEEVHGASRATVNLVLRKAGPGGLGGGPVGTNLSSSIFRADGVTPVANITINAVRTDFGQNGTSQVGYTATSSDGTRAVDGVVLPAGQYSFGTQLPIGDYVVTANPATIIDASGATQPNPTYNPAFATVRLTNPPQPEVTLGTGTTVANNLLQIREGQTAQVTFRLGSSPQKVTGRVVDQNGNPLAGAIVGGVISGATPATIVVQSAATGTDGIYSLTTVGATPSTDIPEGNYVLTASLIGYGSASVTVQVGGTGTLTVPDIKLAQLQPGSVSGLVTGGAKLTTPIVGATVTLFPYVNGAPIDAGKQTTTSTAVQTANGVTSNFSFGSVPPGQYVATAQFTPASPVSGGGAALPLVATSAPFTVTESTATNNVSIVLTPLQTYPAGLQMIALPNDYSGASPYQVFGLAPNADNDEDGTAGLAADQNIYNVFTVAGFREDQSGYTLFGQRFTADPSYSADLRFQTATGYFTRFGDPTPVVLGGKGALTNVVDKPIRTAGWYIIGSPFGTVTQTTVQNVPLNLATDVAFTYTANGVSRNAVLLDQAVADGAVQRVVFDFSGSQNGSQYRQTSQILPFQGYWFRAYVPMTLRFTYPSTGPTRATAPSNNNELLAASVAELLKVNKTRAASQTQSLGGGLHRAVTSKSPADWRLQIAARSGDLMDTDNVIGVSPNAKDGFDTNFDTVKPPMVGQDQSLYLTIDGADEKGRSVSGFSDNIRSSSTSSKTWEFTVQTTSDQEVTLFWPNVNRLPRNLDPVLVDIQTGRRVSLRTGGATYRFQPKGRSAQKFRIEVNAAASRPLALTNVKTNRVQTGVGEGRSVQGAYRFSFTATQEADVTAEIQSPSGRIIRRMQTRAQASHESAFVWDGRDESGSSLPAGTYIISLTAKDANTGALVRTRIPVLSVR